MAKPTGVDMSNTELSFLLDLLLTHKLAKNTKEAITLRIKEVELALTTAPARPQPRPPAQLHTIDPSGVQQPAAVTPAASNAMADRAAIINQAMAGKAPKLGLPKPSG